MTHAAPLRGLLAGLVALVLFASSAVALAAGSSSTPVPPTLPATAGVATGAAAAAPQAVEGDATGTRTFALRRFGDDGGRGHDHFDGPRGDGPR